MVTVELLMLIQILVWEKTSFNDEVVKHNDNKITIMKDWTFTKKTQMKRLLRKF